MPKEKAATPFNVLKHIIESSGAYVFKDQFDVGWIQINDDQGIYRTIALGGDQFREYSVKRYYEVCGDRIAKAQIEDLAILLKASSTERVDLFNRFAQDENAIYVDLGTETWETLVITSSGWAVRRFRKPLFRRYGHHLPLPVPQKGGSALDLLRFLPTLDPETQLLILVWICSVFLANVPRPGIVLHGLQGSGKSTTARFLRQACDPSSVSMLRLAKNEEEFLQQATHNAVISVDNLQGLPSWASDALCSAVTGGGHSKRKLYSDDGDVYYSFQRTFILNGISNVAARPDLVDRSIMVELDRIPKDKRKEDGELEPEFRRFLPRILGGICDTLVRALRLKASQPPIGELPRMADWCKWGMCVAEALGYSADEFYTAYENNRIRQDDEVVQSEPICQALIEFVKGRSLAWEGTPADLHAKLTDVAIQANLADKTWPKAINKFTHKLRMFKPNLETVGIYLSDRKSNGRKLLKVLQK